MIHKQAVLQMLGVRFIPPSKSVEDTVRRKVKGRNDKFLTSGTYFTDEQASL